MKSVRGGERREEINRISIWACLLRPLKCFTFVPVAPTIVFIYTHLSFCCWTPHCKLRGNKNHNVTLTFSRVKLSGNTRCRASSVPVSRFSDQRRSLTSPRDILFAFPKDIFNSGAFVPLKHLSPFFVEISPWFYSAFTMSHCIVLSSPFLLFLKQWTNFDISFFSRVF